MKIVSYALIRKGFPCPSPDGKRVASASYILETECHQANKDVPLRLIPAERRYVKVLTVSFGGRGSMESPSGWPDNRQCAFVTDGVILSLVQRGLSGP